MSNQKYEYLIAQVDLFNAWADSEGFDIKMSSETEHSNRETHAAFLSWLAAKAQEVPEGYCLVPKEIPDSVVSCLENSGFHWGDGTRDHYTPIYSLMVEAASESGAEG